jgi:hypothetical protein
MRNGEREKYVQGYKGKQSGSEIIFIDPGTEQMI